MRSFGYYPKCNGRPLKILGGAVPSSDFLFLNDLSVVIWVINYKGNKCESRETN